MEFIYGVSAWGGEASKYQANDFEIFYDKKKKKYSLGIETAFILENKSCECDYLKEMLDKFAEFMVESNYGIKDEFCFYFCEPKTKLVVDSIEELYTNFAIFVKGYCALYKED